MSFQLPKIVIGTWMLKYLQLQIPSEDLAKIDKYL